MAPSPPRRYRCRFCGETLNAYLPWAPVLDGARPPRRDADAPGAQLPHRRVAPGQPCDGAPQRPHARTAHVIWRVGRTYGTL
jgi:hypothetical protein